MAVERPASAVDELFAAYYADLLRYAARRVGPDAAPDVVAEVFVVVCRRATDVPADAPRAWLFGVASRVVANQLRGERRRLRLRARLAAEPFPDAAPEHHHVHRALARLRPAEQEVLRLAEWDQLDAAEAAAVLGCSRGAYRVRLHRARRNFAEALSALDDEED